MSNFAAARENMVESQVRPNGITDHRITAAMADVPREIFVPAPLKGVAYADSDISLGNGRSLAEPMAFARLVQLAEIKDGDKVLLVGSGVGYGAAVLSRFAGQVVALEQDAALVAAAKSLLTGYANVTVAEGALEQGWKAGAPYDVVIFEGRVGEVPQAMFSQVKDGARVVAAVGERDVVKAHVWSCAGNVPALRLAFDISIPRLPGFSPAKPAFVF